MKKYTLNYKEILADTITPVRAYLILRDTFADVQLLENAEYGKNGSGKSIIGFNSISVFKVQNNNIIIEQKQSIVKHKVRKLTNQLNNYVNELRNVIEIPSQLQAGKTMPPFILNYFGYNSVKYFEEIQLDEFAKSGLNLPDIQLGFFEFYLVFNHQNNSLILFHYAHANSNISIQDIVSLLGKQVNNHHYFSMVENERAYANEVQFKDMVSKLSTHCKIGDVFQSVVSRKFEQEYMGDEFVVYRTLRNINPSPYLFFIDLGNAKIFGSSPETHIVIENGSVQINPIAGTIKRKNDLTDLKNIDKLVNDPKENAEHDMLIDLARNDLSVYCRDVNVKKLKELQEFSHVFHLVSEVEGRLTKTENIFEVFTHTFPAGTLSGAPKHKAMQLIELLEPHQRDFYGGAIGYIDIDFNLKLAITIRTICAKENKLTYMAGAGITINSNPDHELLEVDNKINALRTAIQNAHLNYN